jgi:signal transduction histidine kinase
MRTLARSSKWQSRALAAVVALALIVATALANEAWRSGRAQQAGATRTLRAYARFAALTYRQRVQARLYAAVVSVMRPFADPRTAPMPGRLPDVAELRAASERAVACACGPVLHPTLYFRVLFDTREVTVDGSVATAREVAMLAGLPDSIGNALITSVEWEYATIYDVSGAAPRMTIVSLRRWPDRSPRAIYGFSVPLPSFNEDALQTAVGVASLLPMTPAESLPNDSLVNVTIAGPTGTYHASRTTYDRLYTASVPLAGIAGYLSIDVALNPQRAPELLLGGLPASRLPLLVVLLTLCIGLLVTTLVLAWRATELARLRSEFVANVSHELRTPLAQVLLFGETLSLGRMTTRREVKRAADIIVGESRRLMQLVDNVLLFGRRERGATAKVESVNLASLTTDVLAAFGPLAASAEATVHAARLEPCVVSANRAELRQVLLNLLDNAVKYGPRGQTVTVGVARRQAHIRLWVEDEGSGIPIGERERVWEPFVRLPRPIDAETAGSGIGLAVVREIVTRYGGSTRVEDAAGGGARIVVELPYSARSTSTGSVLVARRAGT